MTPVSGYSSGHMGQSVESDRGAELRRGRANRRTRLIASCAAATPRLPCEMWTRTRSTPTMGPRSSREKSPGIFPAAVAREVKFRRPTPRPSLRAVSARGASRDRGATGRNAPRRQSRAGQLQRARRADRAARWMTFPRTAPAMPESRGAPRAAPTGRAAPICVQAGRIRPAGACPFECHGRVGRGAALALRFSKR
jgi:hypothetical protein